MLSIFINTVHAADAADRIINSIKTNILNPIVAVMFGLALVMFLYGVLEFIQGGPNEKTLETGKRHIIYGILGLAIMAGVQGIIAQITETVNSF
jgi:hypothetical protein